jgi:hypothetical protein
MKLLKIFSHPAQAIRKISCGLFETTGNFEQRLTNILFVCFLCFRAHFSRLPHQILDKLFHFLNLTDLRLRHIYVPSAFSAVTSPLVVIPSEARKLLFLLSPSTTLQHSAFAQARRVFPGAIRMLTKDP